MKQTKIGLDPQTMGHLTQTEASIQEWSVKHTMAVIQARGMEQTVQTLYSRRQAIVHKVLKDSGLDPSRVANVDVGDDGTATVYILPDQPQPQPQPVPQGGPEPDPEGRPSAS